jgi:integrase
MSEVINSVSDPQATSPAVVVTTKRKRRRKPTKQKKPYPGFPLTANTHIKRWVKKIKGHIYYFGPLSDPEAALKKYLEQKDDLYAGRRPVNPDTVFTVEKLVNKFLAFKRGRVDSKELSARSFEEYYATCQRILKAFGWNRAVTDVRTEDFESYRLACAKKWGPHRLSGEVQRVRSLFKFAFDAGHIEKTIRFGPAFVKPSKQRMRQHRAESEKKFFKREEIHRMLDAAGLQLRTMILLGVNCGFGNRDCGMLPLSALDLERGWLEFPRPKTAIDRRIPLWPETVAALREVLAKRPAPKEPEAETKVFVTKYGGSWAKKAELRTTKNGTPTGNRDNPVSKETRKLLDRLNLNGHRNFYCLRHVFETVAGESRDQVAVDAIMGHVDPSMGAVYREQISDERLQAVTEYVRQWLFGVKKAA